MSKKIATPSVSMDATSVDTGPERDRGIKCCGGDVIGIASHGLIPTVFVEYDLSLVVSHNWNCCFLVYQNSCTSIKVSICLNVQGSPQDLRWRIRCGW